MNSTYDVLTAAPELVPEYLNRQGARGPTLSVPFQVLDAPLERAGVNPASVPEAPRVLIVHTIGAAAFATAPASEADTTPPLPVHQLRGSFHRSLHGCSPAFTHAPPR